MRDAEVEDLSVIEDQAPAASLFSQVVYDLTSPRLWPALAVTTNCVRTLCPAERRRGPSTETIQSCAFWMHLSELCTSLCGRGESLCEVFAAAFRKRGLVVARERGEHGNLQS